MNVLIVAEVDHTGAGLALARALNECGHDAVHVSFKRSWCQFPYDLLDPSPGRMRELEKWAHVINVHDAAIQRIEHPRRRRIVMTYHGSWYRRRTSAVNARDRAAGWAQTALTIDLARFGPAWIGRPIWTLPAANTDPDVGPLRVIHAPTQRINKGTERAIAACDALPGVELVLIEGIPNAECLEIKRTGHVYLDQFGDRAVGYGTNSLEAWAMGLPVISSCGTVAIRRAFFETLGAIPFAPADTVAIIRDQIQRMRDVETYRKHWIARGRDHIAAYHSPDYVVRRFVEVCEGGK